MVVEINRERALEIIDKIAKFIVIRKMAAPAIMLIESLRPLNFIGSQLLYFFAPFAEIIFNPKEYQEFAALLENREYVKILIDRIDEIDHEMYREERKHKKLLRKRRINKIKKFLGFKTKSLN
jgi:hypothetical protein